MSSPFRLAFVSGKLGDVDGVSLEAEKWMKILSEMGHEIYSIAGKYSSPLSAIPRDRQLLLETIRFDSDQQRHYERMVFPHLSRKPPQINGGTKQKLVEELEVLGGDVASTLYDHVLDHDIDAIVAENTNAMPMTLAGGIAVHQVATIMRVATIFHHHDFWWERSRFSNSYIRGLLNKIMPPVDLGLEHVVISSYAAHILRSIKRVAPLVITNCEDFDNPVEKDEYNSTFREDLGFTDDDLLILQPTRIVPRKRIEDSVELVSRFLTRYPGLKDRVKYVISLYQGDEPNENYIEGIQEKADRLGISLHLVSERVASVRSTGPDGEKLYTNRDVLVNADLVTYMPIWEGFGNALLEALAARVPVVTTTYLVYKTDMMTSGLQNIEIRDRYDDHGNLVIPETALEQMHQILSDPDARRRMTDANFEIGKREFGFDTLRERLGRLMSAYGDEIRASRQRLAKSKLSYSV